MMSFEAFLSNQDDTITDEEAIKKYAEYKLEFKQQELNEFFVTHMVEEWFKQMVHPVEEGGDYGGFESQGGGLPEVLRRR